MKMSTLWPVSFWKTLRRGLRTGIGSLRAITESRSVPWEGAIERFWQDVAGGARGLRKHAILSVIVVATLTLGIGIGTGLFTYLNAVVLRAHVDRGFDAYARLYTEYSTVPTRPGTPGNTEWDDYVAFRDSTRTLGDLAAWAPLEAPLGSSDSQPVRALFVSCNFFALYDRPPIVLGRVLHANDCSANAAVVVIGERQWRTRLLGAPDIVGKAVMFNGHPVTVVGVVGSFAGQIDGAGAWLPMTLESGVSAERRGPTSIGERRVAVAGRLNPGFSHADAATELRLLADQQDRRQPGRTRTVIVTNGSDLQEPGSGEGAIWLIVTLMFALTALVLITCVNATAILLARATTRRREIAVRLALGAGRLRLVRMLLTETLILAALAGTASLYLAYQLPGLVNRCIQDDAREWTISSWSFAPDWRAFGYLTAMTLVAGVMAGLTPMLQSLKSDLTETLKRDHRCHGRGRTWPLRSLLIGAQVALGLVLLVGAGVFVHARQQAAHLGFDASGLLSVSMHTRGAFAPNRSWPEQLRSVSLRLDTLPGVVSTTYTDRVPFEDVRRLDVRFPSEEMRQIAVTRVAPRFFETLKIPIVRGRALDAGSSCAGNACPVVVSDRLARELLPERDPLGLLFHDFTGGTFEVVGVAADVSSQRLGAPDDPMVYVPWNPGSVSGAYRLIARFTGDSRLMSTVVTTAIRDIAPDVSVDTALLQARMSDHLFVLGTIERFVVSLAGVAVLLALIGVYGVVSFSVSQRIRELAIRVALGARTKDIYATLVLSEGRPLAVGLAVGLVLALAGGVPLSRALEGAPVRIRTYDPWAFGIAAALFAAVGLAVVVTAARHATSVEPVAALKDE
jgi:putative ABC transport system permease protein